MVLIVACIACQGGDHSRCMGSRTIPGMIGGTECPCQGECVEKRIGADEQELERLARALGGGWRIEQGVMPVVALTLREAQALEARLVGQQAVFGKPTSSMPSLMQEIAWFLRDYAETLDDSPHPRLDGLRRDVDTALREAGMHD